MKVYTLNLGVLATNCHIAETEPGRCVAFDIGGDADKFLKFIESKNLKLTKILLTHGHYDHITAVAEVKKKTGAEVYIHENDALMLEGDATSLASHLGIVLEPVTEYIAIREGVIINDGDVSFYVMHTPGHTKGSVCYKTENEIFAGDTLFAGSIGRTDLPGGSNAEMRSSLVRLKNLDGEYNVYTGHLENTTLETERKNNPYMRNL